MNTGPVLNVVASVHQRLLNHAREHGEELQSVLVRYALERLLYRLSLSVHREILILKGAMLVKLWIDQPYRATRDLDFLGFGEINAGRFEDIFRLICRQATEDDGLVFHPDSVRVEAIKQGQEYEGLRIHLRATLGKALIPVQVDIGFGDVVVPAPVEVTYPTLLRFSAPTIRAYQVETVIAEKFQAMVVLGMSNSRLKDFYDIHMIADRLSIDGLLLYHALAATFQRRRTTIPVGFPVALSLAFAQDRRHQAQWHGFLRRNQITDVTGDLTAIVGTIQQFIMPPIQALHSGHPFRMRWPPGGAWLVTSPEHNP